jgi:hypothetical protein
MQRFHQLLFAVSLVALSWFAMMAVHELGHVVGAIITGGSIKGVVLNPLAISRTDVSPNPHPSIVVWLGPVVGSILPLAVFAAVPQHLSVSRSVPRFFAGLCLIANGAYISIGSFYRVGDCGEMLQTGTPLWAMLTFGAITIPLGLYLWHGLGSLKHFINDPSVVSPRMVYVVFGALLLVVIAGIALSPR